jgi:two-component sensor histidine kinase
MAAMTPTGATAPLIMSHLPALTMERDRREGTRDNASRYRAILDAIDHGFCIVEVLFDAADCPLDYRFLEVNAAFAAQTGLDDPVGRTMLSLRPDHERHWFELYGRVALTGEPLRFEREAAALGRWYAVYAFRIDAPEDRRVAILFNDITAQKREAERVRLLAAEVDHRAKNMLTVVASLVRLTRGGTVEAFRQDLLGRVQAMATSQRILADGSWRGADLARLVRDEMAPYHTGSRVTWSGATVTLHADSVQPIAMALHELATNATKYGALSVSGGKVAIEWSRRDGGHLLLCWRESGGPALEAAPTRQGVGTRVVTTSIRDQLGGSVAFHWRREGLVCEMSVPANVVG